MCGRSLLAPASGGWALTVERSARMQAARLSLGPEGRKAGGVAPLPPRVSAWAKEAAVRHMHERTNWEAHMHFGPVRAQTPPVRVIAGLHDMHRRETHVQLLQRARTLCAYQLACAVHGMISMQPSC